MKYQIKILSKARLQFKKLPKSVQNDLKNAISSLADNPRSSEVKKLSGNYNLYRIRVGNYRIIYEIKDEVLVIIILLVGHRKQIYRDL